jgi:hypothetical protein
VSYEHLNPTVALAPGLAMVQRSERFGFMASVQAPLVPIPVQIDGSNTRTAGRGTDQVVDDRSTRLDGRSTLGWGKLGNSQVVIQTLHQDSASGSTGLPVQQSSSRARSATVDTRLRLGNASQFEVSNWVSAGTQDYRVENGPESARTDARMLLDVRVRHSAALNSVMSYESARAAQGELADRTSALSGNVSYHPNTALMLSGALRTQAARTRQLDSAAHSADMAATYDRESAFGLFQFNYGARFETRAQTASSALSLVSGERVTLTGGSPVALARELVVAGTIVVSNPTRTQVYQVDIDYLLSTVGTVTRIQRLATGSILDGQEVLIDYSHDSGGTFESRRLDQNAGVVWNVRPGLSVSVRHFESRPEVRSGAPSAQLNAISSQVAYVRATLPTALSFGSSAGGSLEFEHHAETLSPFRRRSLEAYLETDIPLLGDGSLRANYRRQFQDYANSLQNIDMTALDLRLRMRGTSGLEFSAETAYEGDKGGLLPRRRLIGSLKAQMRYRRASFSVEAGGVRESQGDSSRNRAQVQVLLRRDI